MPNLTAVAVSTAKPRTARYEMPDAAVPGLRLVVQPTGARSWAVRYRRADGTSVKLTLGAFPALDLKSARAKALQAVADVAAEKDPADAKKAARAALRARKTPSFDETTAAAIETFVRRHGQVKNRESHWRETKRILERTLAPWAKRRPSDVTPRDVHAILDAALDRNAPTAANRSLAALRSFFKWAQARSYVTISPCAGIGAPAPTTKRDRVLSPQELAVIWEAAERLGHPFGPVIALLILTGQRRGEVAAIRAEDVDLKAAVWTIPADVAKNHKAHVVHLAPLAVNILQDALDRDRVGVHLFGAKGPPSGWSKSKRRLDSLVGGAITNGWTLHDIRRSVATGMAAQGVLVPVIERLLNHVSGTFAGVAGVYQRHDYWEERRAALTRWAEYMGEIR